MNIALVLANCVCMYFLCPEDGFCDAEVLVLQQTSYYWPDTAQGDVAEIPCSPLLFPIEPRFPEDGERIPIPPSQQEGKRNIAFPEGPEDFPTAYRQCGFNGSWEEPDITACLPCPVGQFFCPFEPRCIDEKYVCDGCTDCTSQIDEENCCKSKN